MIGFELFQIFGFTIYTHGVGIALAALLGIWLSYRQAKLEGYDPEIVMDFSLYAILAGVLGARLWEVAFTWQNYVEHPWTIFAVWQGGLSIQGGILGGIFIGIWFAKKRNIPVWKLADIIAPGLILGMAIGRIGDFMAGDEYGIVSSTFGFIYQQPGTISYQVNGPVPLIPTVLYESAADLMIMWGLLKLRHRKPVEGLLFLWMLISYSIARFLLEFLRGDSLRTFMDLRAAQVASVATIIIALLFLMNRIKKQANDSLSKEV